MELSFRWYGTKDPVKLTEISQSNADFIVTSLHQIPTGEKWSSEEIKKRINIIEKSNISGINKLKWTKKIKIVNFNIVPHPKPRGGSLGCVETAVRS